MGSTQQRHDDIVIQRRFGENASTGAVKQVYAVTYPDHTDQGTERENYGEAEQIALALAEEKRVSRASRRAREDDLTTHSCRSSAFGVRRASARSQAQI